MLDRLDDVDWARLTHAYGPAGDVPGLFRDIAWPPHGPSAARTVDQLGGRLVHQGCVYPATAAAVPFLVELAACLRDPVRVDVLETLVAAAVCESTEPDRPVGVRRALAEQVEPLLGLLGEADPWLRLSAATALGHCDPAAAVAGPALVELARTDPEPAVRCAAIASCAAVDPVAAGPLVDQAYRDRSPSVRAAAIYATAVSGLPWTERSTTALESSLSEGDPLPFDRTWVWDPRWWLAVVLHERAAAGDQSVRERLLASDDAVRELVIDAEQPWWL